MWHKREKRAPGTAEKEKKASAWRRMLVSLGIKAEPARSEQGGTMGTRLETPPTEQTVQPAGSASAASKHPNESTDSATVSTTGSDIGTGSASTSMPPTSAEGKLHQIEAEVVRHKEQVKSHTKTPNLDTTKTAGNDGEDTDVSVLAH